MVRPCVLYCIYKQYSRNCVMTGKIIDLEQIRALKEAGIEWGPGPFIAMANLMMSNQNSSD
ncbi:hypothetical protein PS683_01246 [Pseudomonas fluorescens]|uniref:Uncharacterized protein n=1 Tax=Pseudomonas fluorescens TaxID=294 RepID=A0A5E6R4F9_PSEFL|nr:hypothetical protein PS683_01246 [Pseudomonas fluorescens]VVM60101.1 hypothetical protein PS683_01246 [Pseudomonas fluorescens]